MRVYGAWIKTNYFLKTYIRLARYQTARQTARSAHICETGLFYAWFYGKQTSFLKSDAVGTFATELNWKIHTESLHNFPQFYFNAALKACNK